MNRPPPDWPWFIAGVPKDTGVPYWAFYLCCGIAGVIGVLVGYLP